MARDPGSVWAPLPEAGAPDGYRKTQFIVHSTGDNGLARSVRDNWFARPDVVVESTFIVGWGPELDDPTLQIMDSTDNADANASANQRGISIEVVGDGTGPFTDWQASELVRLGLWARETHGILPRVIPSESEGGFGWHVMFGAPGPWTSVRGKVCPGGVRIGQLKNTVFPAIFAGTPLEDDMPLTDDDVARVARAVGELLIAPTPVYGIGKPDGAQFTNVLRRMADDASGANRRSAAIAAALQAKGDVEVDVQALAQALWPLLAPVLESKLGASKQDVEDALREVFGSLDAPA